MIIAASVKRFLSQYKLGYQVFSHEKTVTLQDAQKALNITEKMFARAVLLGDTHGYVLAVLPLNYKIDFSLINKRLKRNLRLVSSDKVDRIFHDCEPGSHPIIGEPYGLKMIIDKQMAKVPYVYFEPGTHTSIVRLTQADFRFIHAGATWAHISVPIGANDNPSSHWEPCKETQQKLANIHTPCVDFICKSMKAHYPLPPLPKLAHKILDIINSENPCEQSLYDIIEQDPNIANWLVTYAGESCQNPVSCVKQAINYLGVELVAHMALGVVVGRAFQVQKSGPLGLDAFWQHAFDCAKLARELCLHTSHTQLNPATAFLCGLMHNFGFLLFGHLFGPEFKLLNKMYAMNPKAPIECLEKKILGMGQASHVMKVGHAPLGAWLLRSWGLAPELVQCANDHHNRAYKGEFEQYVQLIYTANSLLKIQGIGDGAYLPLDNLPIEELGLNANIIKSILHNVQGVKHEGALLSVGIAR